MPEEETVTVLVTLRGPSGQVHLIYPQDGGTRPYFQVSICCNEGCPARTRVPVAGGASAGGAAKSMLYIFLISIFVVYYIVVFM
jgi:hypothetical protein